MSHAALLQQASLRCCKWFTSSIHTETKNGYFMLTSCNADYKATDDSAPVTAKKEIKLLRLPQILVLHMCRFTYAARGLNKLHKSMQFPIKLK